MATVHLPIPTTPGLDRHRLRRALGIVAYLVVLGLMAAAIILGGSRLIENLSVPNDDRVRATPEAIIRPGNGPAVAATARSRIVSVECTLTGPVEVAPDGTGAYAVLGGAENVRCPDGRFREGFTLRWPAGRTPRTEPLRP